MSYAQRLLNVFLPAGFPASVSSDYVGYVFLCLFLFSYCCCCCWVICSIFSFRTFSAYSGERGGGGGANSHIRNCVPVPVPFLLEAFSRGSTYQGGKLLATALGAVPYSCLLSPPQTPHSTKPSQALSRRPLITKTPYSFLVTTFEFDIVRRADPCTYFLLEEPDSY